MRKLISTLAALCCVISAFAGPAYPGLRPYTQPDGTVIMIRQNGDEFCHWLTDAAGNIVEKGTDGFIRPASASQLDARRAAARIRRAAANQRRHSFAKRGIAAGQKHFLVIMVQFSDLEFTYTNAQFSEMLNQNGYDTNGGTGSARDFYYDNSGGYFEPIFDVYGPVTVDNPKVYYGGNDSSGNDYRPHLALRDGCAALDSSVDFSQYDNDGDGQVDLVFMYYAGYGEADSDDADSIWPHQWELYDAAGVSLTLDGKRINKYACSNEIVGYGTYKDKMCGIGTACHEFGHAMGLPDFYDVDGSTNGNARALATYSLMCTGSYNNNSHTPPYFNTMERILLGWQDESIMQQFPATGDYSLASVSNNVAYKTLTDQDGEFFIYECRSKTGWDAYIHQAGLIVYHVDQSNREVSIMGYNGYIDVTAKSLWDNWTQYNSINENGSHPCFYIVPSGAQDNLYYTGSHWSYPGSADVTSFTACSWNGVNSDVQLSNISYSNNQASFHVQVPSSTLKYNVIANPGNGVYTAGSVFNLALEESATQPVSSVSWYFDDEPVTSSSVTLTAGTHLVEAHLTLQSGETKILELTLNVQ